MAGLGYIVGGALEGLGKGLGDEAKALREQRFQEMGWAHQEKLAQDNRDFETSQTDKQIAARAAEGEKDRAVQGTQYGTNENGETVMIRNGIGTTVKDEAGKPLHATTSKYGDDTSTYVADAKWLVANGIAPDLKSAYERARSSSQNSAERGRMVIDVAKTMATNGEAIDGIEDPTFADYQREAEKFVDRLISSNPDGGSGKTDGGDGGGAAAAPAAGSPPPMKERKVGETTFKNKYGATLIWTENGWEPQ